MSERSSGPARLAVPTYVLLLLVVAAMGMANQRDFALQRSLLNRKADLLEDVALARSAAAVVDGALAVATWARTQGMVPVPEGGPSMLVAPVPAPTDALPVPSLEIRTVWR